jgi:TonB family protein
MYFNFEDNHPDTPTLPRALTRLEVVLLTIVTYMAIVIGYLLLPELPFMKALEAQRLQAIEEQQRLQELERQRERENARFVFVAPRVDLRAERAPDRAELSDIDRRAATVERAPNPTNPLPFARGNTTERIESSRPVPAQPQPSAPEEPPTSSPPAEAVREGMALPSAPTATEPRSADRASRGGPSSGVLADAIRNVQKYVEKESFGNLQGGGVPEVAPSIQFDTKGVEFGPWLRRFIAQIRRNWFVPYAAMSMRGHVVVTFFVHKDGRITDLRVAKPSAIDAFTNSAYNAMASSNPTQPLPPEYPDDRAFFTVTFYFNEGQ